MPFSFNYRCQHNHVTDYLHIGSRDDAPTYIPCEGDTRTCSALAERQDIAAPFVKAIVKGNHDFVAREKKRLTERSQAHWEKQGRHEAVDRIRMRRKADGGVPSK